jgi:uncharacterized protein
VNLIDLQTPQLTDVCRLYAVRELYAFGSIVSGRMYDKSDLDFIVRFEDSVPTGAFDRFMGLKEALELLYGRRVDLLTLKPFRNPVFQAEVNQSKTLIYAA